VPNPNRKSVWAAIASSGAALALVWHQERERRQTAERLAAATLETLLNAVDANDEMTGRHMRRTAAYALCMAEAIGLSEVEQRNAERVALFHDIGKIHAALFDIVHDDKQLTPDERAQIATHPQRGADVLAPLASFYPELPAGVLSHHERWDGTGYPNRLKGDAIPFLARLVAIADTFDAITHSRRYHAGEGVERGLRAIAEGRGSQFDPGLVDVFLSERVQASVRRTLAGVSRHAADSHKPDRKGAERRTEGPETSVPNVRFRWRAPSGGADAAASASSPPAG
jgi:HD-GYP domain-containing protein (c-di-GMP phosphodiesterase class II)